MGKVDDVQLIDKILSGDDTAFDILVKKHQKSVHAFAWRKISDFHIAEEITQDTFLIVHHKLAMLKDPYCFEGWLYRIAAHQCLLFQRKKRIHTQPLEGTSLKLIEKMTYSQYMAEEQANAAAEARRDIVHKLLSCLPGKERTTVTLHYFRGMTCKEVSEFLGVSACTVKSQLHRARHRLKKSKSVLQETLEDSEQINLTENYSESRN